MTLSSHITDVTSLTSVVLFLPVGQRAGHFHPVGFVVDKVAPARVFFSPNTSVFTCRHSTSVPYSYFIYLPSTLQSLGKECQKVREQNG